LQIISTITPLTCLETMACTEVFVSILASIVDKNGQAYMPSKVKTITEGGEELVNFVTNSNYFVVANDSHIHLLHKDGTVVYFYAYDLDNTLIINEKYILGHDCCHVLKIEGKDVIVAP